MTEDDKLNVARPNGHTAPPGVGADRAPGTAPAATPDEIVEEHGPRVYNLLRRLVGNDTDAEDLTHDVLLNAIEKLPTFRGESSLGTWLHKSAVNAALAFRRTMAVQRGHRSREPLDTVLEGEQSSETPVRPWSVLPEQAVVDRETQQLLERAISGLDESYRDVFVLSDVEGLPNAEIAEMLGLTLAAVKSRLHRARMMLRERLAPHFEEVRA